MSFPLICLLLLSPALSAQAPLTLEQAVGRALERYPAVRAASEQAQSAAAGVTLARTSYLPRLDVLAQANRATRNNVFGLLLPQPLPVLPSISGPVLQTNNLTNVWGSAVGVLLTWEPFDFGLRQANVGVAESGRRRAEAAVGRTKLDIATAAADGFLTLLAAEQAVRAAQAGVDRGRVLERVVGALVKAELRPGADASRTQAEVAAAETQVIQAQQSVAVARAALAQLLDADPSGVEAAPGPLLELPPSPEAAAAPLDRHPQAIEQNAAVEEVRAREKALARSYFPKFHIEASSYARGTGANPDGTTGGAVTGLGPNIQNWAVGMSVSFPLMELPSLKARREIEAHHEQAEAARYRQVIDDLRGQREKAAALAEGARRIAAQTPIQLQAARTAEQQATARYRAGLSTIVEVAEAQRLLTQAEIADSLARLGVWRARLALAAAEGDLTTFLKAGSGK